ncbi:acyl-CoA thioesterase [Puniceicoccaceae bacterium K14]|nr:acyl-CoA thioesterase [Puniceicoccaceae bacterium K14]
MSLASEGKREITLRFLAQPTDVNFGGKVHGGSAMKWLDQAGYLCSTGWSGRYCVTAFVGDINFHNPILVGDLVEVDAKIIHTGRTSMHIGVTLNSCNPKQCEFSKSIHCIMVFVALDEGGKPVEVPQWQAEDEADIAMEKYAIRIMDLRCINQKELDVLIK